MIVSIKKNSKQIAVFVALTVVWVLYFIQIYPFFSQVNDFITPGSPYMIKILEFTNYRGKDLSILLIEYFVLISISAVMYLYIYKRMRYNKDRKLISYIISINTLYILIVCLISNIFWTIYILLTILAVLVLMASVYVSSIFFDSKVKFQKGDIIFYSDPFETERLAEIGLKNKLKKMDKENTSNISGDVFNMEKEYFFEIYANDQLILDSKGEFIVHEKEK